MGSYGGHYWVGKLAQTRKGLGRLRGILGDVLGRFKGMIGGRCGVPFRGIENWAMVMGSAGKAGRDRAVTR